MKRKLLMLGLIVPLMALSFTAACVREVEVIKEVPVEVIKEVEVPVGPKAPAGAFVDPETEWWPGRTGPLPEDAPTFGVGFLADLSGTLGFWNAPRLVGASAVYDWICDHEYGIAGRKPELRWFDHKSNATEAKAGYAKIRLKYIINHSCGTGEQQMLKPNYGPDKFLTLTCSQSPNVTYPIDYVMAIGPYWTNQYAAFIDYALENNLGTKMAYITYPSGYGRAFITPETEAYNQLKGIEVVADIACPWAPPDPESILTAAKDAGAEIVFTNALYATMGPFLKANYEGGYNIQFCVNNLTIDEATIALAGQTEDGKWRADGLLAISNYVMVEDLDDPDSPYYQSEGMTALVEYWDTHFVKPEDRCSSYIQAWAEAFTWKEAVEETLLRVGSWDKVTSREIRLTMEGEGWWDHMIKGMWITNISPTNRDPLNVRILQVQDGKWVPITGMFKAQQLAPKEWLEPWID